MNGRTTPLPSKSTRAISFRDHTPSPIGLTLMFPSLSDDLTRPLVALGDRLSAPADRSASAQKSTIAPSLLLGVATGLLRTPRWTRAWPHPDRRGASSRQCRDQPLVTGLRRGSGDLARARLAGRGPGVRGDEVFAGHRRVDSARNWRRGACGRRRDRFRPRYRISPARLLREHGFDRAEAPGRLAANPPRRRHPRWPWPAGR